MGGGGPPSGQLCLLQHVARTAKQVMLQCMETHNKVIHKSQLRTRSRLGTSVSIADSRGKAAFLIPNLAVDHDPRHVLMVRGGVFIPEAFKRRVRNGAYIASGQCERG